MRHGVWLLALAVVATPACRGLLSIEEKTFASEPGDGGEDARQPDVPGPAPPPPVQTVGDAAAQDALDGDTTDSAAQQMWTVSTFVGTTGVAGTTDGNQSMALLQSPFGLTIDGSHLYVQSWPGTTRDVDLAWAMPSTTVSVANADGHSVVIGNALYAADWWDHCIKRVDLVTKEQTVFAGSGQASGADVYGWRDGIGTAARFDQPRGIATDGMFLYVVDQTMTLRKIDPATAEVTTIAGAPYSMGKTNGTFDVARFFEPLAITYAAGKLYVTDIGNVDVRTVDLGAGVVSRLAGGSKPASEDGIGVAATFNWPYGIASDGAGHLFVVDRRDHVVRRIDIATAEVTTIAGKAGVSGWVNGRGPDARFDRLQGIALDASGNIYVSEYGNHTVRKISTK